MDAWVFKNQFQTVTNLPVFSSVSYRSFSFLFYRSLNKIGKESQKLAKEQSTLFANIAHDLKHH